MGHPCFSDQPADHDDTVREADQRVNDPDLTLGADRQLLEPSVVPRISSFHHPAHSGLKGFALGADLPTATQLGKQLPRLAAVIASIQMDRDLFGQSVTETGKTF